MLSAKRLAAVIALYFLCAKAVAQSMDTRGWLFWSHTQKLSKKWDIRTDAQLRSVSSFEHMATLLLRGAFSYNFNDIHSAALGYVYKPDWDYGSGKARIQPESRIFEQYLLNTNAGKSELTGRFRLEQRFIKETTEYQFSQRARAFVSIQIPLAAKAGFSKGLYTTLQNEVFVNVQNKANVNNSFFDQNRAQVAVGYRWSRKLDTDVSYMFWLQKEADGYASSSVVVLMLTTSL